MYRRVWQTSFPSALRVAMLGVGGAVYRRGQLFRRPQRPSPLSSLPCFLLPVTHTALPLCRGEGDELAPSQVSPVWSLDYCSIAETRRPVSSTEWQRGGRRAASPAPGRPAAP